MQTEAVHVLNSVSDYGAESASFQYRVRWLHIPLALLLLIDAQSFHTARHPGQHLWCSGTPKGPPMLQTLGCRLALGMRRDKPGADHRQYLSQTKTLLKPCGCRTPHITMPPTAHNLKRGTVWRCNLMKMRVDHQTQGHFGMVLPSRNNLEDPSSTAAVVEATMTKRRQRGCDRVLLNMASPTSTAVSNHKPEVIQGRTRSNAHRRR